MLFAIAMLFVTNLAVLLSDLVSVRFLQRCMECRRGLAMRILSVGLSVRLSVRLSVTRVDCDKTVERSLQIYIPYERTFSLVF